MAPTTKYLKHDSVFTFRHARFKAGVSVEDIAKADKVTVRSVKQSIDVVETQNTMFGMDALERAQIEVILYNQEEEKRAINRGLKAEKRIYVESGENAGDLIASEPDHDIQLRAVEALTAKSQAVIARHVRGSTNQTNVNMGTINNVNASGIASFEDRLREVMKKRTAGTAPTLPPSNEVLDIVPEG